MRKIPLTIATGNYDRVAALIDGRVSVEGCDVTYLPMEIEQAAQRAFRYQEFDVSELSCSTYIVARSQGVNDYIGIPVFLSRMFRHSAIYIRDDVGINSPADLRGKKVGVPVYTMTAALWVRGILKEEYGVAPPEMTWFTGGLEDPGRTGHYKLPLRAGESVSAIPEDRTLSDMFEKGELDVLISARIPSCFERGAPHIKRLFPDYHGIEREFYKRTKLFPIMHVVALRQRLAEEHPWLASSLLKAFIEAKQHCFREISDATAPKVMLPWLVANFDEAISVMGNDYWRYGFRENLPELTRMTEWSYTQGLSARQMRPEELFVTSTHQSPKV